MTKRVISLLFILLISLCLFSGCKEKTEEVSPLVGSWEGADNEITYTYTFAQEGSGNTVVTYADMSDSFSFDWKTQEDTLSLTFKNGDSTHTQDFGFELKDNTLTLTYEENILTLKRK